MGRGRVVMLVDNHVTGDSRVQKSARSMAEAGWEVILLGRSSERRTRTWRLGGAEVRLIRVPMVLHEYRKANRRTLLGSPLAYPDRLTADHRVQRVKAWRWDLRQRGADLELARRRRGALHPAVLLGAARLAPSRAASRAVQGWVRFRKARTDALHRGERSAAGAAVERMLRSLWPMLLGDACWRRLAPQLRDYELAYGKAVDELRPDIVHANDARMLGVGARAKRRAAAEGRTLRLVWDAHEFTPGIKPWDERPGWLTAQCAHERAHAASADAVVTVSDELAGLLQDEHRLGRRPAVVLNAPDLRGAHSEEDGEDTGPGLRESCGIGPRTPLVVYSGAPAEQRGLQTLVEGMPHLDEVHTALVVLSDRTPYMARLLRRAEELGVRDRLHVLPYVEPDRVVPFLAEADAGAIPLHHWPNHELSLVTKFFEYSHARLPIVVSDVRTMAEQVRCSGQGRVFRAGDTVDYVRAVRAVLAAPEAYAEAYRGLGAMRDWTWDAQAAVLNGVYRGLLPEGAGGRVPPPAIPEPGAGGRRVPDERGAAL